MFVLIGTRTDREYGYGGWTDVTEDIEDPLALFDTMELATKYAEDSELAAAKKQYFRASARHSAYRFKQSSLLRSYDSYEIREYVQEELIHNPTV